MDGRTTHVPRRIPNLLNDQPDSAAIPEQVLPALSQPTGCIRGGAELNDPLRYLQIFRYLMMTAFPATWDFAPALVTTGR